MISFLPGPEEIAPWLTKLREVEDSPLVLSDQQKQVRLDGVLEEATRALYPVETRAVWARRLLTTAYYLHLTGRAEDARAIRAAAADLADPDRSALTGENLFLKSLVQSYGAPGLGDAAAPGTRDAIRPGGSTR